MKKGDLFIHFEVKFPRNLTEDQRRRVQAILGKDSD
jgi:DnaJ-class molecular chaperone